MMNEKQIYKRMNQCYENEYGNYDDEAEWYGSDDIKEWMFYIPSKRTYVMLKMEEENKEIRIFETKEEARDKAWKRVGIYSW